MPGTEFAKYFQCIPKGFLIWSKLTIFHLNLKNMKKITILFLIVAALNACTKSTTSTKPPPINIAGFPVSYIAYFPTAQLSINNSFKYDSNKTLASVALNQTDTVSGVRNVDSGSYFFDVNQTADLPIGYIVDYKKPGMAESQTETHVFYYNGQNQLIKDSGYSVVAGPNPNVPTRYYTYSGNTIVVNSFENSPSGWNKFIIDTLITSNGNLVYQSEYINSGGNWVLGSSTSFSNYSTFVNPFYDQGLAYTLGAFLVREGIGDFISKNLPAENGFTWVKNPAGKVVSGSAANGTYVLYGY
jgi:hypothetical protein